MFVFSIWVAGCKDLSKILKVLKCFTLADKEFTSSRYSSIQRAFFCLFRAHIKSVLGVMTPLIAPHKWLFRTYALNVVGVIWLCVIALIVRLRKFYFFFQCLWRAPNGIYRFVSPYYGKLDCIFTFHQLSECDVGMVTLCTYSVCGRLWILLGKTTYCLLWSTHLAPFAYLNGRS